LPNYLYVYEFKKDLEKHPFNREAITNMMRKGLTIWYRTDLKFAGLAYLYEEKPLIAIDNGMSIENKDISLLHELMHWHVNINLEKWLPLKSEYHEIVEEEAQRFYREDPKFPEYVKRFSKVKLGEENTWQFG